MLKLGKLTDYAVAVLGLLAQGEEELALSASAISQRVCIPEPTVAKVLKLLAKGELVVSSRGASGGYRLSRSPKDISLAEIIIAMEGPIALVACVDGQADSCSHSRSCPTQGKWDRVNGAVRSALEGVCLAEMAEPTRMGSKVVMIKDIHVHRA